MILRIHATRSRLGIFIPTYVRAATCRTCSALTFVNRLTRSESFNLALLTYLELKCAAGCGFAHRNFAGLGIHSGNYTARFDVLFFRCCVLPKAQATVSQAVRTKKAQERQDKRVFAAHKLLLPFRVTTRITDSSIVRKMFITRGANTPRI